MIHIFLLKVHACIEGPTGASYVLVVEYRICTVSSERSVTKSP